ncbi:lysophospholipid acyltransferase family protein [Fluoribacter dumoffii]|uniref:Lipid A biosynthesis lauroyl acyltransferase n=1 Tax=Fluoribacter dumoffii TaxID=463 RepID=A0A377GEU0_9GAMM|nr:lysophospholipid acyltransferase family protein [Fluoribacter dumoffii]KTC91163.1 lipid A lauroyl acyltransferase [Fluoribacter dumoffii NY 23]MCW8416786.1 lysophospholipid acyltransferase family protein [Fluoribacter dumoffii]MCW8455374.1 lysophospholipid acyltransferase family protein [Fluoribacter dumoffii]MCW8460548.1 lysophospholipid acyltransferase family protein [Fluoribacter dumoffii]MCW8484029.1 lysophospholipid acyltransferase family protein [Fluoribacter dumoffii]
MGELRSQFRVSLAGFLFYHLVPLRRPIVLANIDRVFKNELSTKEKKRLAKAYYSHVATLIKELLFMNWLAKRPEHWVEIRGVEHLLAAKKQGRGCFVLTGHLGNWELAVHLVNDRLQPLLGSIYATRKAIRVKWLERFAFNLGERYGVQRIDKTGAPLKIVKALKNKETIFFVMDQHAELKNKEGIAVNFFNTKAGTYRSLAFFANKFQTPVVPAACYRQPSGKHVVEFHPALPWETNPDEEQAIYNNTLNYNQKLEQLILEHPEQWWWAHRRWKL